jgi:hypothetical protein
LSTCGVVDVTHGARSAISLDIKLRRALIAGESFPLLSARADTLRSGCVRSDGVRIAIAVPSVGALNTRGVPDPARCAFLACLPCEAGSAGADAGGPDVVGGN